MIVQKEGKYYSDQFPKELQDQLAFEEGVRLEVYKDSVGLRTIGIGHNIEADKHWKEGITKISRETCWQIFEHDLLFANMKLEQAWPHYALMHKGSPRKWAMLAMAFQLGTTRFMGFKQMRAYIERGMYGVAANEALNSQWAKQCPNRAMRVAQQIETNEWYKIPGG